MGCHAGFEEAHAWLCGGRAADMGGSGDSRGTARCGVRLVDNWVAACLRCRSGRIACSYYAREAGRVVADRPVASGRVIVRTRLVEEPHGMQFGSVISVRRTYSSRSFPACCLQRMPDYSLHHPNGQGGESLRGESRGEVSFNARPGGLLLNIESLASPDLNRVRARRTAPPQKKEGSALT
jgi:hypothetical protein